MKKKAIIILIGMVTGISVIAQKDKLELRTNYPDSLVMETEDKNEILFLFNRMSREKEYISNELWDSMLNIMETALIRSELEEAVKITYRNTGDAVENSVEVRVEPFQEKASTLVVDKDEIKERLWSRLEFLIILPQLVINFHINSLEELEGLKELNIGSVWKEVQKEYENEGKVNLYKGEGTFKYGMAQIDKIEAIPPQDNLSITFLGLGLGYYRDRFVPDIGSMLAFKMHNRLGEEWISFGALYTRQFFFSETESGDFDVDHNGFVSAFFKVTNMSRNEFGVGFGGLVHREGNFYQGGTYKMSFYFDRSSDTKFTYSPEFIFTNDFKSIFPAFRIGLTF